RRAARTDHVGKPHAVSHAAAVRPHGRLGRAGAPRSRGAMVARLPAVLAPNLDRASAGVAARSCCAVRHSLCLVHRSRPAALDPALGRALIAVGLDRLPEETLPPPELRALELPAIELSQPAS